MTFKRAAIAALSSLAVTGATLTGATVASASSSSSCSAQGDYAICTADATFSHPVTLTVHVSASPSQPVSVY